MTKSTDNNSADHAITNSLAEVTSILRERYDRELARNAKAESKQGLLLRVRQNAREQSASEINEQLRQWREASELAREVRTRRLERLWRRPGQRAEQRTMNGDDDNGE